MRNAYSGTAITSISNSFRDNESFLLTYRYPIYKNFFITSETKYNLLSDRNSFSDNKLQRISEQVGLVGRCFDLVDLKFIYGLQDNTQGSVNSLGHLLNASMFVPKLEYDGYNIDAGLNTEFLYLQDGRDTRDIDFNGSISKQYNRRENLLFSVRYKNQKRNFLQTMSSTAIGGGSYSVESNIENRIGSNLVGS